MNDLDENNVYLMTAYAYFKGYRAAMNDFNDALRQCGYGDMALVIVRQRFREKMERFGREVEELGKGL